ncbi:Ribokinase [Frondihabitans sp. 762G35]|uniref:ribokinase n=1 Tax=Frondihabitans sp. 762G35 TaxID=1446794 RepID=UPI000D224FC2|nr:ribokinase [Frondihabitans sp. 762G35]ARC57502.1 Ribokinase [Frondihabitans sp. 762G35]
MNGARIIVVGSANQDYLVRVERAPRPGETVIAHGLAKQPGGKGANQAVAAARLGGDVTFVGAVGRDDDGASILRSLQTEGVQIDAVRIVDAQPTGLALISVEEAGENSITVVSGANATVTPQRAVEAVQRVGGPGALVLLQGELTLDVLAETARAAAGVAARVIINLAPYRAATRETLVLADPLVVNETETASLTGATVTDVASALAAVRGLVEEGGTVGARSAVITLGSLGAVWADADASGHAPARKTADVVDTTGAGDAFVGALAASLAGGSTLPEAVRLGVAAGSFAIRGVGAQTSYARPADLTVDAG